jgi:sugar transferase (PEP-CTERM/EpsH1 system associated)
MAPSMHILFIAPRFPCPALFGYQVRAYHQLRLLSLRHRITLLCLSPEPPPAPALEDVARFCDRIVIVPHRPLGQIAGLLRGLASPRPLQSALFDTPALRLALRRLLAGERYDLAHVQLLRMAPSLDRDTPFPRVLDLVDALSLNMERRHRLDRGPTRWAAGLEARRLARYERHLCSTWDHATVVSEADRRAIGSFPNLTISHNGVDLDLFGFDPAPRDPGQIVFTGNLGYFPNTDAAVWFSREILPLVRREEPGARLCLVGARPRRAVRALARQDGALRVEGPVPDLRPYLTRSRVAVAPLRAGSGQLFKVLEALACGTPVVATPIAASGLDAEDGRHLLIAEGAEPFARQVVRLLRDEELCSRLAREGRRLVEQLYGWDRIVADLDALYESVLARARS